MRLTHFKPASVQISTFLGACLHFKLPFAAGAFDLVTCAYSFANFPHLLPALREFTRVARTRGRIAVIDVLAPKNRRAQLDLNRLERLRSGFHTRTRNCREILDSFRRAHLKTEAVQFHHRFQPVSQWLRLSGRANSRRFRGLILDAIRNGEARSCVGRRAGKDAFCYDVGWFLLRPLPSS